MNHCGGAGLPNTPEVFPLPAPNGLSPKPVVLTMTMSRGGTASVAVNVHTILKTQVYHVPAVLWQYSVNAEMKTCVSEWSGSVLEAASP